MSTDKKETPETVIRVKNVPGTIIKTRRDYVDMTITHPKLGESTMVVRFDNLDSLKKSTGMLVENMCEFLCISDRVLLVVDTSQGKKRLSVSRLRLLRAPRPSCSPQINTYLDEPKRRRKFPNSHVPATRTGEIVALVSDALGRWCKVPTEHLVSEFVGERRYDPGGVFQMYLKSAKALRSFVRSVPDYFDIDNEDRVCAYEGFNAHQFTEAFRKRCTDFPLQGRLYSMDQVRIIPSVRDAFSLLRPMLRRAEASWAQGRGNALVIGLDCEGCHLGKTGRLTLVQLSTVEGLVFLFDVVRCPQIIQDGLLKEVLESPAVIKVIHDCRQDAAALYHQYGVRLTNIFDTSVAYMVLQDQCQVSWSKTRPRISFKNLCELVGEDASHKTKAITKKMRYVPDFWARRPLRAGMINYAAADVYLLLPNLYNALVSLIHPNWWNLFQLRCRDTLQQQMDETGGT